MNIVQPRSATTNSKSVVVPSHITRAARRSPGTGALTSTGTSTTPPAGLAAGGPGVVRPSPSTTIGDVPPVWSTLTNCSGASAGPTNRSVDSAEVTPNATTPPYVVTAAKRLQQARGDPRSATREPGCRRPAASDRR